MRFGITSLSTAPSKVLSMSSWRANSRSRQTLAAVLLAGVVANCSAAASSPEPIATTSPAASMLDATSPTQRPETTPAPTSPASRAPSFSRPIPTTESAIATPSGQASPSQLTSYQLFLGPWAPDGQHLLLAMQPSLTGAYTTAVTDAKGIEV